MIYLIIAFFLSFCLGITPRDMPIYHIPDSAIIFPHPFLSEPEGILGIGGDLSPERLLLAYQFGIFPWYSEGEPIMWWAPHDRFILIPHEVKIQKSMRTYFNNHRYILSADKDFVSVINHCKNVKRPGQKGTWITEEMVEAYTRLHKMGYAHSIEVWEENDLVGGLYGISLGKVFFGESMFSLKPNASKFGFISLSNKLHENNFRIIDCQQPNKHLASLGARHMSNRDFHHILRSNCLLETDARSWADFFED